MAVINSTNGRLVTLRPGRYWKVYTGPGENTSQGIDINVPTNALLLEFQGKHNSSYVPNNETCWHALVGGSVILVWESHFDLENNS